MAFTPTALAGAGATRFGVKKNLELVSLPAIAATTLIPTQVEINAGTNLTCAIQATSGFTASDTWAELPDLCSDFTGKVWNGASLADSSITFYLDESAANDAYDYYSTGDVVRILQCPWGLAGLKKAITWVMEIGSVLPPIATEGASLVVVNMAPRTMAKIALPAET
ncbi:hypothetical protein [Streptomyces sp.]|uniref:phage tail tube protein n=1 Tax=Streptomyces sp. TaxID=1931 RepID=UPI002F959370